MIKELNTLLMSTLILISISTHAQKERIFGLWRVENVVVGEENMTPVAKWFKINPDGSYQAGNGWLQNGQGNWNYDAVKKIYSSTDSLGITDEFGGFTVSFQDKKMLWKREEEGMNVKVILLAIDKLPMSPADYLKGIWDLVEITENDKSILNVFDKEDNHKLFFRWDRVFINFSPEGVKHTSYWHINGHRPEITLLPHQESEVTERWKIEVNKKELIMTGISESNRMIERKYARVNSF